MWEEDEVATARAAKGGKEKGATEGKFLALRSKSWSLKWPRRKPMPELLMLRRYKMKQIIAETFRNHYISYDDFYHRIEQHRIWLLSQGGRGTRLKAMGLRIWCEIRDETLVNADFYCCDFSGARFIDCNFEQATFTNCTFRDNPKFSGNFRNASFNDCNLHTLDLSEAQNLEWRTWIMIMPIIVCNVPKRGLL